MKSQLLREYEQRRDEAWRAMNEAQQAVDAEVNAWMAECEEMCATLFERIRWCNGEGKERAESHKDRHKRLSADYRRKADLYAVAKYNARKKHAEEIAEALAVVFKKYAGKQYGKATAAKMTAEVGELAESGMWFEWFYDTRSDTVKSNQDMLFTAYKDGARVNCRDENNTIHAVDEFRVWGYGHDYIDDAEAYVDKCAELRRKAEEAAAVAQAAERAYNAEKVEGLPDLRL